MLSRHPKIISIIYLVEGHTRDKIMKIIALKPTLIERLSLRFTNSEDLKQLIMSILTEN